MPDPSDHGELDRPGERPFYHVGIVVPDLDTGMAAWSEALGVTWGAVERAVVPRAFADRLSEREVEFVISRDGPPYIELLPQSNGEPWTRLGIHHLGAWSTDVAGESDRLTAAGCPFDSAIVDPEGRRIGGCYHEVTDGSFVELVSLDSRERLRRYLAGELYL